jgi:2-methylcitrate dehydratase PrpD
MSTDTAAGKALGAWAAGLRWADVPQPLRGKVLDHVVDIVGVMYSGIDVEACAGSRRAAVAWGNAPEATVVGTPLTLPAPSAAFLNALHARIHTYDDTYEPGTMHAGSPVVSAALALAEKHALDGRAFLAAVLAGYEIASRVAAAVSPAHYASGFHNTGTCTVFGAAAASARLLGLDGDAIAEAWGLAGATAGGLRQHQIDGSMLDSAFHGARAAQSGVMVAQLRAQGVRGPAAILEGPMGFCAVMGPKGDVARLTAGLGVDYEFAKTTIKPYPTCRFVHGPIEAALQLKQAHRIDPAAIRAITISTFRQSIEVSDRPALDTPYDAVVSHQYAVALALVKDNVELRAITDADARDPAVLALMRKVRVVHDPVLEQDFPQRWPHRVAVEMENGERYATLSEYPPGRVAPIPSATVDRKFLAQSASRLGEQGAARALEALRALEDTNDMRTVTAKLAA